MSRCWKTSCVKTRNRIVVECFQRFENNGSQCGSFQKMFWKSSADPPEKNWNSMRDLPEKNWLTTMRCIRESEVKLRTPAKTSPRKLPS